MPSRYLRENYLTSPRINAVEPDARDCWVRLLLVVDDHGRYFGDAQLIASRCYPTKPDAKRVERLLAELARVDLLERYEIDGRQYLLLTQWRERVRSLPKYPAPPTVDTASEADLAVLSAPSSAATGTNGIARPLANSPPASADSCAQLLSPSADNCEPRANTRAFSVPIPIPPTGSNKIAFDPTSGWVGISDEDRRLWKDAFPAIDLDAQLARARVWVLSKKARKKDWRRFLLNWFGNAQDEAPNGAWKGEERRTWQ